MENHNSSLHWFVQVIVFLCFMYSIVDFLFIHMALQNHSSRADPETLSELSSEAYHACGVFTGTLFLWTTSVNITAYLMFGLSWSFFGTLGATIIAICAMICTVQRMIKRMKKGMKNTYKLEGNLMCENGIFTEEFRNRKREFSQRNLLV